MLKQVRLSLTKMIRRHGVNLAEMILAHVGQVRSSNIATAVLSELPTCKAIIG